MQTEIHPEQRHRFNEACESMTSQLRSHVPSERIQRADTHGKKRYIAGPFIDGNLALQLILSFDLTTYEINTMIRSVDGDFMTQDAILVVMMNFVTGSCRIMHKNGPGPNDLIRTITRGFDFSESTFPQGAEMRPDLWRNLVAVMLTAFGH
ncbi:hypothetical protein IT407_00270 [Candidatus Uhrbacteria bacterium]|nr:hypothetical protein [Candidatus Uhrbacteria bacterium]